MVEVVIENDDKWGIEGELLVVRTGAFETQLDQWDAFLVFAVKQLGGVNKDQQFRDGVSHHEYNCAAKCAERNRCAA